MLNTIKNYTLKHNLINHNDTIIIGLSGGPDSVFLLHFLKQIQQEYNLTLIAAHLNHEWRAEADAEEQLCHTIAKQHNTPFFSTKISALSHSVAYNGSKEEYARKIRRFFLKKMAQENKADSIALGHHVQDQQETFFIRLIRGTSLTGLTAMKPKHGLYIRPLLEINKKEILEWLKAHHITHATDISNESPLYLRNRIRTMVLPALHTCDQRFDANFLSTLERIQRDDSYLNRMACQIFNSIAHTTPDNTLMVDCTSLFEQDPALQYRLIMHWLITENVQFSVSQAFFDEIKRFLQSSRGGTHIINNKWSIVKKSKMAFIQQTSSVID